MPSGFPFASQSCRPTPIVYVDVTLNLVAMKEDLIRFAELDIRCTKVHCTCATAITVLIAMYRPRLRNLL